MGWNSWNSLRCEGLSHDAVLRAADKLVSSGLALSTVVIDDCWMASRDGGIVPDAAKFPFGMAAVADAVHERGLKFGIYSDSGLTTCEGFPGSQGYEELDAATYASWGVDFLKYDFCNDKRPAREAYSRMARALQSTGRDIRFSLCSWGAGAPWQWGATVGHSWRTGRDLFAAWDGTAVKALGLPNYLQSVLEAADNQARLARFAGPGGFNDPDMLVVGLERGMTPYGIVDKASAVPRLQAWRVHHARALGLRWRPDFRGAALPLCALVDYGRAAYARKRSRERGRQRRHARDPHGRGGPGD